MPALEEAGHRARGADREIDVTDAAALRGALRDFAPQAVVHLAALSSVALSFREPERCYRINFLGTRTLLDCVEQVCPEARVLLVGSADQYAATRPGSAGFDERTPLAPRSPYARSKAAAELLGQRRAARGLDVVRIRAFNHSGRGQDDAFVLSSFARQLAAIRRGDRPAVMRVGNLDSVRDFLHVDDVVRAYLSLLDPAAPADVYNVASERGQPIGELLASLIALAGVDPEVEIDPERWRPTDWLVGDASKLRDVTGWAPRVPIEALLQELFDDWLERDGADAEAARSR